LNIPVTGVLGTATRSAVRRLQRQEGLPVTGIVSPSTEEKLQRLCEQDRMSADREWQGRTGWRWEGEVGRGADYIRWMQSTINKILGLRLTVDGIVGPQTRSAIRAFQQQKGLTPDGIVGPLTERALISAGASRPPGSTAGPAPPGPHYPPPVTPGRDSSIEALNLAEPAKSAAYLLKAKHPWVVFTSGRRDLSKQAWAMAGNVLKNRKWIVQTYASNPVVAAAQQWVDSHPEAQTQQTIADGLLGVFRSFPPSEVGRISRHLVGLAFDIQPVPAKLPEIEATIRGLPGMTKFLTQEGGLTIWHVQFQGLPESEYGWAFDAEISTALKKLPSSTRPDFRYVGRLRDVARKISGQGIYMILFKPKGGQKEKAYVGQGDLRKRLQLHLWCLTHLGVPAGEYRVFIAPMPGSRKAERKALEKAVNKALIPLSLVTNQKVTELEQELQDFGWN
jgi:peptidoglycan hydrolase-like protein with peptidoglycan-binding domain